MKNFRLYNGPFVHSNDTYRSRMFSYLIVFIPFLAYVFYSNGINPYLEKSISFKEMLYPLIFVISPIIIVFVLEILYKTIFDSKKNFKSYFKTSFALFSSLFTSLLFNINTPFWIIVLATIISYVLYKILFNKVCSLSILTYVIGMTIVIILGKSVNVNLSNLYNGIGDFTSLVTNNGGFDNLLLDGSYLVPGLISIFGFLYLILKKDSKYLISCSALISILISTFIISLISGVGIWYPFYFLLTNGVLFLILILASDFYGPATIDGQIMYGLLLGLLIIIFRYISNVDITFMSLFVMNTFSFFLDKISELGNKKIAYIAIIILIIIVSILFGIVL